MDWPATVKSPALALLLAGAALILTNLALLAFEVQTYLADYRGIDSDAGLIVFRLDGKLVSYPPFETTVTLTMIGAGIALCVGALLVGAIAWRGRRPVNS